jgi:hypothetical protein
VRANAAVGDDDARDVDAASAPTRRSKREDIAPEAQPRLGPLQPQARCQLTFPVPVQRDFLAPRDWPSKRVRKPRQRRVLFSGQTLGQTRTRGAGAVWGRWVVRATSRWRCWRDPCARRAEGKALRRWRAGRRDLSEGPPLAMGRRASARRPPRPPVRRRNPAVDRARRVEATPSSLPSPKARAPRAPRRRRRPVRNARPNPPPPRKSRRDGETAVPAGPGAGPGAGADPGAGAVGAVPIPGNRLTGTPSSGLGRRWSAAWKTGRFASASCASARGDGTRRTSP